MNIAQVIMSRYESEDFYNDYADFLCEDRSGVEYQINRILKNSYNDITGKWTKLTNEQMDDLLDFIVENSGWLWETFYNYWVGENSIASVSFGEQEEQLEGLYNHRTGKKYTMPYLRRVFDEEGYCVTDDNYAYYDLSSKGVHIKLTHPAILEKLDKMGIIHLPETIQNAWDNHIPMYWDDPQPDDGNDYRISSIQVGKEKSLITYNKGESVADIFNAEIIIRG